jgi:hypothetical protein
MERAMTPQSWTRRLSGLGLVLLLALFLPGCFLAQPLLPESAREIDGEVTWKVVMEKREPNLLVAADWSVCEVSFERFEKVQRRDRVFCHWRGGGARREVRPGGSPVGIPDRRH